MASPLLLTVILNYRTPEMTLAAIAAALREMEGIAGEIVVVENGSGDDSFERLEAGIAAAGWPLGRVTLLRSHHNGGFGAGNNIGLRHGLSDGRAPDYVYLLNSDAQPEPGAIRALLDYMQAAPEVGIAGSYLHGADDDPHQSAFRFPTIAGELEGAARTGAITRALKHAVIPFEITDQPIAVDWVAGASALFRRAVLDEIGLFDETFFLYFEETDLCLRAKRAGWQVHYVPASRVMHIGSVSTGMKAWARTPGYWFDSRLHYFRKNHGAGYAALATLARALGAAIWRLRVWLQGKPLGDPPHFLADMLRHALRAAFHLGPRRGARGPNPTKPLIREDT